MLFWNKICGFTAIFFLAVLFAGAQTAPYIKFGGKPAPRATVALPVKSNNREAPNLFKPFAVIPQNYYTLHFGIMCKKELAIEKATKIPFRFRLGSLQQCNYLEGKR